jgi:branched chain amino acid efflux pump
LAGVTAEASPETTEPAISPDQRRTIVRDAFGIAVATGAYGLSFGALSAAAGLSIAQTCALSLLMFTGASQFALIGVLGGGGSTASGVATATLLGARNAFYGVRMTSLLRVRGLRKLVATQLVIDETTAMAVVRPDPRAARMAFWTTGLILFAFWNAGTFLGALGGDALSDPGVLGLDAAAPAAFLALLAPQVRAREPRRRHSEASRGDRPRRHVAARLAAVRAYPLALVAMAGAVVAVALTPLVPAGVPVLAAGAVAVLVGLTRRSEPSGPVTTPVPEPDDRSPAWDGESR